MTDREHQEWRLPAEPLRSSVLGTDVVALAVLVGVALLIRAAVPLSSLYPLKVSMVFGLAMLFAIGRIERYHPFASLGPANQVTTARFVLVALAAGLIGEPNTDQAAWLAVALSLAATILDGVDGWLARQVLTASPFGARFDMETDALLIQILAILAWQYGKAGPWVLASGLLRYAFVAAGWVWSWIRQPLTPSLRGKIICVVQISGLITAVSPLIPPTLSVPIAVIALVALSYSFGVDTLSLWRRAA